MKSTEWQSVVIEASGIQRHLKRAWECDPAWSIYVNHSEPDGVLPLPDGSHQYIFWNRHLDSRFTIDYPHSQKNLPRTVGGTIGDMDKEWDIVEAERDRYLADAGLTLESPAADIARCLADTFRADSYFKDKTSCVAWGEPMRELANPVEGLLHKSFCVGCAHAYAALADMSGFPCRTIGLGAHRVAEVLVDGRWHMVENSCRHQEWTNLAAYMPASYLEISLDPNKYPEHIPARKAGDYLRMCNPQFHFMGGSWQCPRTLRFSGSCAKALYPELDRIGFKSIRGRSVPLVVRAEGFYWEDVAAEAQVLYDAAYEHRQRNSPYPVERDQMPADYLFHPFEPGAKLRQSVWLGDLDVAEGLEVVIPFAPQPEIAFDDALGKQLELSVNGESQPLSKWGAWPPKPRNNRGMRTITVEIPVAVLQAHAVNWIELRNASTLTFAAPFIPAAMDPYIPPLAQG